MGARWARMRAMQGSFWQLLAASGVLGRGGCELCCTTLAPAAFVGPAPVCPRHGVPWPRALAWPAAPPPLTSCLAPAACRSVMDARLAAQSVLLAKKYVDGKTNPKGWWMSEKLDGVRAYW